jgi:hypothetical protein
VLSEEDIENLRRSGQTNAQGTAGFVIQQVDTIWQTRICPGSNIEPKNAVSQKCGTFISNDDNARPEVTTYWEIWPLTRDGQLNVRAIRPRPRDTRIIDIFSAETAGRPEAVNETYGFYYQTGSAWLFVGPQPPGGVDFWRTQNSPAKSLQFSCNKPPKQPASVPDTDPHLQLIPQSLPLFFGPSAERPVSNRVGREVAFTWNCCSCPKTEPLLLPHPSPSIPHQLSPHNYRVWGLCPQSQ